MKNIKPHHIISLLAMGGIIFAALNFSNQPLFTNLDQFVLVAQDKIHLANSVQISSGDLAANKEIAIAENNIINSNLFSDKIKIAENTQINGNASFNELKLAQNSEILGATSTPLSLPVVQLPSIPTFPIGIQDLIVKEDQTLNSGNFNRIEVKENITLTLNPGIYNLNKLELRANSKLLFSGKTAINVKEELKINEKVLIAPNVNISATDLEINFAGNKPIAIGQEAFISVKLLAPKSTVHLGERITFRGQILAKEIKVGEDSIIARQDFFSKESDPTKIVEDQGVKFIVNEILVLFKDEIASLDVQQVADLVDGRITGFIPVPKIFKIEIATQTVEELNSKIQAIKNSNNPLVVEVVQNLVGQ